jgi:hypothetical protein
VRLAVVLACTLAASGCGDQSTFALGRQLDACEENLPTACGVSARCVLDGDHYLSGMFPSARRFLVRTAGETTLHFLLLLTDEHAPGTDLELTVHEPTCGDRSVWDSAGRDLFRLTDQDGVLALPMSASLPGDHLVELASDAYCSYALRLDP